MKSIVSENALILGLGNDILTDDGVGIHAARKAKQHLTQKKAPETDIEVLEASIAGVALLDVLNGFSRAVIIDAVLDSSSKAGTVAAHKLEEFVGTKHLVAAHQIDLPTAVALGKEIGAAIPEEIFVVTVVAKDVTTIAENCSEEVEAAIEPAAKMAIKIAETGQLPV
jgi:hydrogenase maturation protease